MKVKSKQSRDLPSNIIPAGRFRVSKNQIQLLILEFCYLGHQIGSFSPGQNTMM